MKTVCMLGVALLLSLGAFAQDAATNSYTVTNLVTNATDANLINPWGLSRPVSSTAKENEWWTADQVTGLSSLYDANGAVVPLVITIPPASGTGKGSPAGTVFFNNNFAFATLDGTISNWFAGTPPTKPGTQCAGCHILTATIKVNHASAQASYTGMTVAGSTYFVANSHGGVEAYNASTFAPVTLAPGAFVDANVPASYKPFGIQAVGSKIYVTFYNSTAGGGYVDAFDTTGKLLLSLQHGKFNEPWGIAQAPSGFGVFSGSVLVANTANGWIGAYNTTTGAFKGFLKDATGNKIAIPGIWGILFGNGNVESGPVNTLYFNSGGNYLSGIFGAITAN